MNPSVSKDLCLTLERLFPKEEVLRIDGGNNDCYMIDSNENEIDIYAPLNLSITTKATHIPEFTDDTTDVRILISIPYSSHLIQCLAPTLNASAIFEAEELLFNANITPTEIAYLYMDEEKEETNNNLSELIINGTSAVSITPHLFNDNIEVKEEHMGTLQKNLTLWALGTKQGEQSLHRYLEKTAKSNGVKI
jgi:hypothetical protein